jgi:Ca-activated chloride channel family protein
VRRFLLQGQTPPRDAVRIEELINYFPYEYREPEGDAPVAINVEVAPAPWRRGHHLVRIGLQAKHIPLDDLPPSNLVLLIDVSGSMQPANKLPLLKSALRLLVEQLRPVDRVAVVVYAGRAGLALESTSGARKGRILEAINGLEAGGSTAGGAGLRRAYAVAVEHFLPEGNNRVILATDGDFNVGESSDAAMVELIEHKRRSGVFLTVLGVGQGNLQDAKMEKLADHGNGNYAYVDNLLEAQKVLVQELGGTLFTVAQDVKVQVEFNPDRIEAYRLIGYENRMLEARDFNNDRKDAGEMGAGHSVTALYEVVPVGGDPAARDVDPLRYPAAARPDPAVTSPELLYVKVRYKAPNGERSELISRAVTDVTDAPTADFRFQSAVAEFGMLLRASRHRGDADWEHVVSAARGALGRDPAGYRAEFVRLAELASSVVVTRAAAR